MKHGLHHLEVRRPGGRCGTGDRGFSMIELIVVLSIILVLTSLLMPGITKARHAAFRLMCASNMRQVGMGLMLRAEDHNGRLPESRMQRARRFEEMCAVSTGLEDAGQDGPSYDGLGTLWEWRYLDTPRCLYCPAHNHVHTFDAHAPYYESIDGNISRRLYANYHYTGSLRMTEDGQVNEVGFRNINRDNRLVLMTDALRSRETFSHNRGMNVLFSDCSTFWEADSGSQIWRSLPTEPALEELSFTGGPWVLSVWAELGLGD